jgi:hypothetical protein
MLLMRFVFKIVCVVVMGCATVASATTPWKLRREEHGIKVYTASTDTSCIQTLLAEFPVQATTAQLVQVLLDAPAQPRWVYNAKQARVLKQISPDEVIIYSVVGLPWPCSNRDYVAHVTVSHPSATLTVIDSHSEEGHMLPQKGLVRVRESNAHWEITEAIPGHLLIRYQLRFNPGGALPAWLVNLFITRGPCHTFRHLQQEVAHRNAGGL